jgi:hypothetical protein
VFDHHLIRKPIPLPMNLVDKYNLYMATGTMRSRHLNQHSLALQVGIEFSSRLKNGHDGEDKLPGIVKKFYQQQFTSLNTIWLK